MPAPVYEDHERIKRWATFDLSLHSWYEPIERLINAAEQGPVRTITPKMGEVVDPERYENGYWWKEIVNAST